MASSRFAAATEEEISSLVAGKESRSTKNVIEKAKNTFKNFLAANGYETSFELMSREDLNERLRLFFASIKKKPAKEGDTAEHYKKNAYVSLKYGLSKYIKENVGYDINEEVAFQSSRAVYEAMLKKLKQVGLGATSHYPPISEEDMDKLYSHHHVFNTNTPVGLQSKVWFEIMYYFCRRGRENLRCMNKNTFDIGTDAAGQRYVFQAVDEATKNHNEKDQASDTNGEARMYELPGNEKCPVASFEKYLAKLHPQCDDLWQRPLEAFFDDEQWYYCKPVGKNTLSNFMKEISHRAQLAYAYTNHSIRATHITILDNAGFEARHIMRTSGHKSETSIRSYSHALSESKKRKISATLSKSAGLESTLNVPAKPAASTGKPLAETHVLKVEDPDMSEQIDPFQLSDVSDTDLIVAESRSLGINLAHNSTARSFNFCPTFNNCTVTLNFGGSNVM